MTLVNSHGFRGVRRYKDAQRERPFFARLKVDNVEHYSAAFATAEEAARAYDEMATRLHGDRAVLNFGAPA